MPRTPDFDALYRSDPDPFAVGSRWYEQRKIAVVLASLAHPRYELAWDVAAGTGHLAAELAARSRRVLATDASQVAIDALADPRSPGRAALPAHVVAARSALPDLPAAAAGADLVVVSEVLYYLPDRERAATLAMLAGLDAEIVTVHWRHHPHDAHLSGADVAEELHRALAGAGSVRTVVHEDADFVLSVHVPAPARGSASTVEAT